MLDASTGERHPGSAAMYAHLDSSAEHQAVTRLFELARAGAVDNVEYNQLDSLVYSRLLEAYECDQGGIRNGGESIS